VLARAIHEGGASAKCPYMILNCAALPAPLIESELFGHEKGAFTDARVQKRGLFETADGGTLVLDEIGELDFSLQAKLLRGIEERCIKRVGGIEDIPIHARIIAITNIDLEQAVTEGRFRRDLFYRLNVIPLRVPPLRERPEDIPPLVEHFVNVFNKDLGTQVNTVSRGAMSLLSAYPWPGNVRELRNVLERIMVLEAEDTILVDHLPSAVHMAPSVAESATASEAEPVVTLPPEGLAIADVEKELIRQALTRCDGNISHAAKLVGLQRDTLRYRARKFGVLDA
jgi:two-component system response regulator AtoC